MEKYKLIRLIFDAILARGEAYDKADAISSDCTRDGLINRVYIKKLNIGIKTCGSYVDNAAITCTKKDFSDATDSDVRIEFGGSLPSRVVLWANDLSDNVLTDIVEKIKQNV